MILTLFIIAIFATSNSSKDIEFNDKYTLNISNVHDNIEFDIEIKIENNYCGVFSIDDKLYANVFRNITKRKIFEINSVGSSKMKYIIRSALDPILFWSYMIMIFLLVVLFDITFILMINACCINW